MPSPLDTARAAERRVAIVDDLVARRSEGRPPPTTRALAAVLEVSDRTIRVDLMALEELGVITRDGSARGIALDLDALARERRRATRAARAAATLTVSAS